MALIWAKKSTGLPIDIISAHLGSGVRRGSVGPSESAAGGSPISRAIPAKVTTCKLDIDIQNNVPQVREWTSNAASGC